jgi:hypothetical protein
VTALTQGVRVAQPGVSLAPADTIEETSYHLVRRVLLLAGAVVGGWLVMCALQTTHASASTGRPVPSAPTAAASHTLKATVVHAVTSVGEAAHQAAPVAKIAQHGAPVAKTANQVAHEVAPVVAGVTGTAAQVVTRAHTVVRHTAADIRNALPAVHRIAHLVTATQPVITPIAAATQNLAHRTIENLGSMDSRPTRSADHAALVAQAPTAAAASSRLAASALAVSTQRLDAASPGPTAPRAAAAHGLSLAASTSGETPTRRAPAPLPTPSGAAVTAGASATGHDRGQSLDAIAAAAHRPADHQSARLATACTADLPGTADNPSSSPD